MSKLRIYGALLLVLAGQWGGAVRVAQACPFCPGAQQTLSQELESMDVAVIARLVKAPPPRDPSLPPDQGVEFAKSRFEVVNVLKAMETFDPKKPIETLFFGEGSLNKEFLIMAVRETPESTKLQWSTPMPLTERGKAYMQKLPSLPKSGAERLAFFQEFFEDKDEMLARDAYDEFGNAPYAEVKALKDKMHHDKLVAWITDENVPSSRRRLYLTMLGVCGSKDDLPMLEGMLKASGADDKTLQIKAGLDALIACYITLRGEEGLPLIEDLYFKKPDAAYADTYAAIMALRFHGTEGGVVKQESVVKAMRQLLNRPKLADLIIPDLARWQDWESMETLVKLFKDSDEKTSWVRVPVINYLRVCPLPKAKEHLSELEKIDPEAVKRANSYFPVPVAPPADPNKASDAQDPAAEETKIAATPGPVAAPATPAAQKTAAPTSAAVNPWTIACVPWVIGAGLLVCQWGVLRGVR